MSLFKKVAAHLVNLTIFGLLAVIFILQAEGYSWSIANNDLVVTSIIDISTYPKGATIHLDSEPIRYTTPYALRSVAAGWHQVAISKDGYQPYHTRVLVKEGLVSDLSRITLTPLQPQVEQAITITSLRRPEIDGSVLRQASLAAHELGLRNYQLDRSGRSLLYFTDHELWRGKNDEIEFIDRYSTPITGAILHPSERQAFINHSGQINLCDLRTHVCQSLTTADPLSPMHYDPSRHLFYFISQDTIYQLKV